MSATSRTARSGPRPARPEGPRPGRGAIGDRRRRPPGAAAGRERGLRGCLGAALPDALHPHHARHTPATVRRGPRRTARRMGRLQLFVPPLAVRPGDSQQTKVKGSSQESSQTVEQDLSKGTGAQRLGSPDAFEGHGQASGLGPGPGRPSSNQPTHISRGRGAAPVAAAYRPRANDRAVTCRYARLPDREPPGPRLSGGRELPHRGEPPRPTLRRAGRGRERTGRAPRRQIRP